jgi:hypothetical protein
MPYRSGKPKRDRGVYRAVANPNNVNHAWAVGLIKNLNTSLGVLRWVYRDEDLLKDLVYKDNRFFSIIKKASDLVGKYIPVPFAFGKKDERD